MAKVYVKFYDGYEISGNDFLPVQSGAMRRIVFSPNGLNAIAVSELPDGCLLMNNESGAAFEFSVSRNQRVFAIVKYRPVQRDLQVNTNWWFDVHGVVNQKINTNPDLIRVPHMNINVEAIGLGRMDVKVNDSGYAACIFGRDLLFVQMDGNHAVP